LLSVLAGTSGAEADVITIVPSKDNTLYEDGTGSLSNGGGGSFFAGKSGMGVIRRAVLAFDIGGEIPAGSTINSVSLTLRMSRTTNAAQPVSLHKVLADWGEGTSFASGGGGGGGPATAGDATWLHTFYNTDFWTTAGGDFVAAASAVTDVNEIGFYTWGSTRQMVADVQSWVDNPAGNFGWILVGNEVPAQQTGKRFDSRESTTAAYRPMLTINFTPLTLCAEAILSDLNKDCQVDFYDFAILASEWLKNSLKPQDEERIIIDGVGEFGYFPQEVETLRSDIFQPGHFSVFDVLVHLDDSGTINMAYHFDPNMNTYVIDSINGTGNWWYRAHYDGGWQETNAFRMDHFPYKEKMYIRVMQEDPAQLEVIYTAFAEEIVRRQQNGGKVIIPEVTINVPGTELHFFDVELEAHNLRTDTFKEGVITAVDIIMSMGDQGLITYDLQWYDSIGTAGVVRSYWVERINEYQASGMCGFVYESGALSNWFDRNHIHLPSDYRVLNSPEYAWWFWIELGPCN
jgi:hypothetical protein